MNFNTIRHFIEQLESSFRGGRRTESVKHGSSEIVPCEVIAPKPGIEPVEWFILKYFNNV
ncbi:hypothetical protein HanRHA438_Chr14g0663761 [Helianthus annuus]|nr:hypothetical protein HanHA89_Chr14g0579321 [Helianthus annuus]KAJ0628814.1 hypothetical protein HanHA300_Chr00c0705g0805441 [Helianthus annuus]KAJ0656964.1 hypothetical protein HanLR1_Chr14g0541791 [Helianthus annuus]KAJ0854538.1 hypothetical protein HanRHA438_Chr14g0663701 [Helianthus annuus]KAJ0854544.1 hypothetical protein HanRHA438_Chr14g0663761 [Helianthus annuus]